MTLAPLIGGFCRYVPSCSVYARGGHPAARGAARALARRAPPPPLPSVPPRRLRPRPLERPSMEERRLLIAVALSLLVLTAYQFLFPHRPRRRRRPAGRAQRGPVRGAGPAPPSPPPAPSAGVRHRGPVAAPAVAAGGRRAERRVEVAERRASRSRSRTAARGSCPGSSSAIATRRGRPEEMVQNVPGGPRAARHRDGRPRRGPAPSGGPLPALARRS